ncbi:hypothetical protein TNCV_1714781 [Trichonephila clavipes]|nr:hypothetical protein TNCV_1714781 [Trichonephila clavipes]
MTVKAVRKTVSGWSKKTTASYYWLQVNRDRLGPDIEHCSATVYGNQMTGISMYIGQSLHKYLLTIKNSELCGCTIYSGVKNINSRNLPNGSPF